MAGWQRKAHSGSSPTPPREGSLPSLDVPRYLLLDEAGVWERAAAGKGGVLRMRGWARNSDSGGLWRFGEEVERCILLMWMQQQRSSYLTYIAALLRENAYFN